jgi:hypothetical protein
MEEHDDFEHLGLPIDEQNVGLSALFNSGVEEALATLSPAQLAQLEKNVQTRLKKQKTTTSKKRKDGPLGTLGNVMQRRLYDENLSSGSGNIMPMSQQDLQLPTISIGRNGGSHTSNLPASAPLLEIRDGIEYLIFTYSTKGQLQEFSIKTDVDYIQLEDIPDDFKSENCVYPRAFCLREQYIGNRWEYETACNELAWKLTWGNSEILAGKRGLIQRAVDSYRNRLTDMRSRRVIRQEKICTGTLRRRANDGSMGSQEQIYSHPVERLPKLKQITVPYTTKGAVAKMRIRIDIENVADSEVEDEFKKENMIYPADTAHELSQRTEYELSCNELAWKLAWLNPSKLAGKHHLLQKAIECYRAYNDQQVSAIRPRKAHSRSPMEGYIGSGGMGMQSNSSHSLNLLSYDTQDTNDYRLYEMQRQEEFSEIVANTLQQALSHHDLSGHDLSSVVGDLDLEHGNSLHSRRHSGQDVYQQYNQHVYDNSNSSFY